ncbi:MgtE intracellular N domain protein [uncultured archaeon]|nr:MgtE intracellular N domain protein [uncultured archaeon]
MLYYSKLIGKPVIDKTNRRIGYVKDLAFTDKDRYAIISGVVIEVNGIKEMIPWKYILEIGDKPKDPSPIEIYLNEEFKKVKFCDVCNKTLKEVIDKQLMDINGARVIRVNDILLGRTGNKLIIVGVDISTKGLLRRLGLGFIPLKKQEDIILWKDVAQLSDDKKGIKLKVKRERINKLHPAEIADMIRDLNLEEKQMIFNSLDRQKAAETLLTSQPDDQRTFFKTLTFKKLAKMLETLPNDDAAAILNMMPSVNNVKVLRLMKPGISAKVKKVLSYEKRTAGSLMSTRFLSIPEGFTIKKSMEYIRKEMPKPRHVFYLYVKSKDNRLKGVISLRDLILAKPGDEVSKLIKRDIMTVNVDSDLDEVFNIMSKYSLLALPVIDKDKKIVGIIRVNNIIEAMIPERIKTQRISKYKRLVNNHNNNLDRK